MSNEIYRYKVVTMLSEDGNRINYKPHGPEVVMASDYAALEAECSRLRESLKDADAGMVLFMGQRNELAAELAAIRAAGGEQDPSKILLTALRQYMHNDGSGLVAGYEYEETQRIVAAMAAELAEVRRVQVEVINSRNAHQWECERLTAELEAARKQEPIKLSEDVREYLQEGINSATQCEDADMDYDFANELGKLLGPLYRLPPLAGQVGVPRELHDKAAQLIDNWDSGHPSYNFQALGVEAVELLRDLLATPSMEVKS